jgi:hypothetical protein
MWFFFGGDSINAPEDKVQELAVKFTDVVNTGKFAEISADLGLNIGVASFIVAPSIDFSEPFPFFSRTANISWN